MYGMYVYMDSRSTTPMALSGCSGHYPGHCVDHHGVTHQGLKTIVDRPDDRPGVDDPGPQEGYSRSTVPAISCHGHPNERHHGIHVGNRGFFQGVYPH